MRLSVVLPPHVGTCLASVVHELVQRLEDAAPLARPDAADGRRHRRLGEVGDVLGQLLLVLFLHRRRFVWLPRAVFGCSFLNDVGMVRPARLPCRACFKGSGPDLACRLPLQRSREYSRDRGLSLRPPRTERYLTTYCRWSSLLARCALFCGVVGALCTRMLAGW